jgi:hypothetical protein
MWGEDDAVVSAGPSENGVSPEKNEGSIDMWLIVALIFLLFLGALEGIQHPTQMRGGGEDDIRIKFLITKQARHPRAFFDQKYYVLGHVVNPSAAFLKDLPEEIEVRDLAKLAEDAVVRMAPIAVWGRPAIERKWEIIADAARSHTPKMILFVGPSVEFREDYYASFNIGAGFKCVRENNGLPAEEQRYYRRVGYDICKDPPIDAILANYKWRLARKKKYNDAGVSTRHIPPIVWVADPHGQERFSFGKHVAVINVDKLIHSTISEGRANGTAEDIRAAIDAVAEQKVIVCLGSYPFVFGLADYMFCVLPAGPAKNKLRVIPGQVAMSNPTYAARHLVAQGYIPESAASIKEFVKKLKAAKTS